MRESRGQGTLAALEKGKKLHPGSLPLRLRNPIAEAVNPNAAPPWLLLEFLIALEREVASVLRGSPGQPPPAPPLLEFFSKFQQVHTL